MGNALRKDVAVFHQVPAKSVDALSALTHQEIAGPRRRPLELSETEQPCFRYHQTLPPR